MRHDLNVLCLALEHFIRVCAGSHHIDRGRSTHLLLCHLARCVVASEEVDKDRLQTEEADKVERDRGHPTGIEITRRNTSLQHLLELWGNREREFHCGEMLITTHAKLQGVYAQTTKPLKNALIQPIIIVCGTIIVMFPFIIPIIPSMAAGSVIGFAGGCPLPSGFLR